VELARSLDIPVAGVAEAESMLGLQLPGSR
jgi:hypothetical protein